MKKRLLNGLMVLGTINAFAQEFQLDTTKVHSLKEVVITDSRFPLQPQHSGKNVIVITSDEIERNQTSNLAEIINTKSGIEINGSRSNAGQNLSTYIRGGNNRQVLVMIDGIPVSDPSQIANDYDLKLIDINQIERVEIIKGAASTLYGNAASTAVINIYTKRASDEKVRGYFGTSIGTNQSTEDQKGHIKAFQNALGVNGSVDKFTYRLDASQRSLGGLSAVESGTEKDDFVSQNAALKLGYAATKFSFDTYAAVDAFNADFDNSFPLEDAAFVSKSTQYRIGIAPKYYYKGGTVQVNAAYSEAKRDLESSYPASYDAKSWVADVFNKYSFGDNFHSIIGFAYRKNEVTFTDEVMDETLDPYINFVWNADFGLNINAGVRLNNHNAYGAHLTYSINPSFHVDFDDRFVKVLGSYSTSFIAPTLSQLYGPFGANANLDPETNITVEGGLEFHSPKWMVSAVYFHRNEEDFIDYVTIDPITYASEYRNTDTEFTVEGVEVDVILQLAKNIDFMANYTFTDKMEKNVRLPKHKANASVNLNLSTRQHLGARFQYVDKRTDMDFVSFTNVELGSFTTVDVMYDYQLIANRLKLSASVNNIFNEAYNELVGYSSLGRNYRLGVKINF
ncbi:TonB-dependent receptor [Flavobacteriaceae bacterium F08102]|nr:TonB-dependent receptor [Flavobacteriaceae bacterium F08102]